jgi:hypothetical protein
MVPIPDYIYIKARHNHHILKTGVVFSLGVQRHFYFRKRGLKNKISFAVIKIRVGSRGFLHARATTKKQF